MNIPANKLDIVRQAGPLATVIDALPLGIVIIDEEGLITMANSQAVRQFGYTGDELLGQGIELLIPERYRNQHDLLIRQYLKNPATRPMGPGRDLTARHKDGSEFPVEIGLNTVQTENGKAVIATVIDISERKRMENSLRQANADLDEFTYVASHDLKSPLRGIANLVEWVGEDLGDAIIPDVKNNLERINLRIERMENLIEDLLNYARAGKYSAAFEQVDLNELFDNVIELLDVPLSCKISIDNPVAQINTHKAPLETVIRNLISNAIKHNDKEEGRITITVRPDNSWLQFEITDNGPGIPASAHRRIFKLFQTLDSNTTDHSGVGLAVTKRLIEAHHGTIEVISEGNQGGTSFRFRWPRYERKDLNE